MSDQPERPPNQPGPGEPDALSLQEAEAVLAGLAAAFPPREGEAGPAPAPASSSPEPLQTRLQWAEARFRTLVESIPAVTFLAGLDNLSNDLYVSPQIESLLGFSQKEWLDNPILWYTHLHPDDRLRWHTEFARTIAQGEVFRSEYRFLAKDGRVVWVQGEARFIHDEQGRPVFLQGVAIDITAIKQAELSMQALNQTLARHVAERTADLEEATRQLMRSNTRLRNSEARLQAILDTTVDGIVTISEKGLIEGFNQVAERLFGYSADEVRGRNVAMLMPSPYHEEHNRYLAAYRETGVRKVIGIGREVVGRRKDGTTFPMDLSVSEVILSEDGGKQEERGALSSPSERPGSSRRLFAGLVRDITQRKETEQALHEARLSAEAASQAKSEFLSRMSHELRTPLNVILGFGQLLEMARLPGDQRDSVAQINRSGKHLLGLINEVLDIARIEAGRMAVSLEPVRISDAFGQVLELVQPLGAPRNIRFWLDLGSVGNLYILADNQKLKQVLLNLLSNAVKYNVDGGEVRLSCEAIEPGRLRLIVSDTGRGIPAEKLPRLFTPFDRLGAEQTGVEGSGLGLALSKRLVELMGGALSVTSVVGTGSRFCLELMQAQDPRGQVAPMQSKSLTVEGGERHTVLYIEDNPDNLKLIQCILAHRPSIHLLTAMQGSLGMELARRHQPDLILLDMHLPDMYGEQVLNSLRADTVTQATPVVIISADATPRRIEQLRSAGIRDYLTKPLDVFAFLDLVDTILKTERRPP